MFESGRPRRETNICITVVADTLHDASLCVLFIHFCWRWIEKGIDGCLGDNSREWFCTIFTSMCCIVNSEYIAFLIVQHCGLVCVCRVWMCKRFVWPREWWVCVSAARHRAWLWRLSASDIWLWPSYWLWRVRLPSWRSTPPRTRLQHQHWPVQVAHSSLTYLLSYFSLKPSVLWRCWLGGRKGMRPVKNWVMGCWYGYLSGARCRLAYGPADATAIHYLLLQ